MLEQSEHARHPDIASHCVAAEQASQPVSAIDELRSIKQWVGWKYKQREGQTKPTKPPVNPHNGRGASHSNPLDWGSHKQAEMARDRYGLAGVGFVLSAEDEYTGIDLDNCRDPETEELEPWAEAVVALAETYWEVSPSGRGLRAFVRGKVPASIKCDPAGVEIYGSQRYMTVTEAHVEGAPLDIRPAPKTLEMLIARVEAMRSVAPAVRPAKIDTAPRAAATGGGSDFFKNVNDLAMDSFDAWVKSLLPQAKYQPSTGAWRVTSKDLGRDLEEDLSIHPTGIVDHGVADMGDARLGKRTPIDLVMEHGGAPDAIAAARWLCENMGKTPESLGWNDAPKINEEARRIGKRMIKAKLSEAEAEAGERIDAEAEEFLDDEEAIQEDVEPFDWDALVERTKEEAGAPFATDVLKALASLSENDVGAFETILSRLKKSGCRITQLEKAIREHGRRKPVDDDDTDDGEPADDDEDSADDGSRRSGNVYLRGITRKLTNLAELNARFAILKQAGSSSAFISRKDFLPIQDRDLYRRLANEVVHYQTKTGEHKYIEAAKYWTTHALQHVYRRVAFTSKTIPDDTLNLFKGFGVVPKAGNCLLILTHIKEVICSGNETDYEAMLNLLAWQIQNIGKPSRTIVILKSEQHQVGKGVLLESLMLKIYGESGFGTSQIDQVIGRFNSAIRGKAFVFLDEALFHGDRKAADKIKSLATATAMGVEEKGLPIVQCPVAVNLWLATNHEAAAHVEEKDERYWVLDVSEHRFGDADYFTALTTEIENGGREAFAHFLLSRDVSNFVPWRDVPKNNAAKAEMIRESINPFDARKWLEDCCYSERLIGHKDASGNGWAPWHEGARWPFHQLRDAYVEWQKTVKSPVAPKPTASGSLGEVLGRVGFEDGRTNSQRGRKLPSVDDCLARLANFGDGPTGRGDSRNGPRCHH